MKQYIYTIIACLIAITMTGCKSNQQKAEEFAKAQIESGLTDVELSKKVYEPIKTIVRPAKNTGFNNKECWIKAKDLERLSICISCSKSAQSVARYAMDSAYPFLDSNSEYIKKKYEEGRQKYERECFLKDSLDEEYNKSLDAIRDTLLTLDDDKIIGFEILHLYKLNGSEYTSRYVVDENFNEIINQSERRSKPFSELSVAYEQCYIVTSEEKYDVIKRDEDQFVYQNR